MTNHKYTDQLVAMKPLCRDKTHEALHKNEYTNKLTD